MSEASTHFTAVCPHCLMTLKVPAGFSGQNDGLTDLTGSSNCGSSSCPDHTMSDTYSAASNGNTAQTGQLDLSAGGTINTSTATTITACQKNTDPATNVAGPF